MSDPDLTPQEPGTTPDLDTARLDGILRSAARDIPGKVSTCTEAELTYLHAAETSGKKRPSVLKAIATTLATIEAEGELEPVGEIEGESSANIGNRLDYAQMRASDIDPTKIDQPVLSRDGWVLPLRKTEGA